MEAPVKEVDIDKEAGALLGLGLSDSSFVAGQVVVEAVETSSPALGLVHDGDAILAVNGQLVTGAEKASDLITQTDHAHLRVLSGVRSVARYVGTDEAAACSHHSACWKPTALCSIMFVLPLVFGGAHVGLFYREQAVQARSTVAKLKGDTFDLRNAHARFESSSKSLVSSMRSMHKREIDQALARIHAMERWNMTITRENSALMDQIRLLRGDLEVQKHTTSEYQQMRGAREAWFTEHEKSDEFKEQQLKGQIRDVHTRRNRTMALHLASDAAVRSKLTELEANLKALLGGAIAQLDTSAAAAMAPAPPPPLPRSKHRAHGRQRRRK